MNLKERRQQIWQKCKGLQLCAVTKGRTIAEINSLLTDLPELSVIAENRWPDCEATFSTFPNLKRHFIGSLQSNKVNKVLQLIDCLQALDSEKLLARLGQTSFLIQVNTSRDPSKSGLVPSELRPFIKKCLATNKTPQGLMTIGSPKNPQPYFAELKTLFDKINSEYFATSPMPILSMGMSGDYEIAIKEGATMVRLGSCLF